MTRSGHPATRAPGKRARRPRRIHGVAHKRRLPGTGSARARAPTRAVQDEPSPPQHAARVRSQAGDVAIAEAPYRERATGLELESSASWRGIPVLVSQRPDTPPAKSIRKALHF